MAGVGLLLINYGHPITGVQLEQIGDLSGQSVVRTVDVAVQFDESIPFEAQAAALITATNLNAADWQTLPLIINLPSYSYAAITLLSQLHGVMGHFPAVLRLRPVTGVVPTLFEVAEILDLDGIRQKARGRRR